MKNWRFVFVVLGFVLFAAPARAHFKPEIQHFQVDGRDVAYWEPWAPLDAGQDSKSPLILISHGYTGCNTQFSYLGEALAMDGYWVVALQHSDAGCGQIGRTHNQKSEGFDQPEKWDDTTYADRGADLRDLVKALQRDPRFKDKIDFSRIGLAGHSLGGYAALALAGAWPSWKRLPGLRAVIAFSPFARPFLMHKTLGKIDLPVMYQGGTFDVDNTPWMEKKGGAYDETPAPKYFVEFDQAEHRSWTDLSPTAHNDIIAYSEAFFDHYVKGLPALPTLTAKHADVTQLCYDSDLGKADSRKKGK